MMTKENTKDFKKNDILGCSKCMGTGVVTLYLRPTPDSPPFATEFACPCQPKDAQ